MAGIRTLEEECIHLHDFETLEEAGEVLAACIEPYNKGWLLQRHRPAGADLAVVAPVQAVGWCWFFGASDHCASDIVAWHVAKERATDWAALEPIRARAPQAHMSCFGKAAALGLALQQDWASGGIKQRVRALTGTGATKCRRTREQDFKLVRGQQSRFPELSRRRT